MAKSISDLIEQFLLETIADQEYVNISRNQLAGFFKCVPSQINYVLSTRFTIDRGFIVESRRGGGGYITILKIPQDKKKYIAKLSSIDLSDCLSANQAENILCRLEYEDIISEKEKVLMLAAISDKSLMLPDNIKEKVRASIFKNMLTELLKYA